MGRSKKNDFGRKAYIITIYAFLVVFYETDDRLHFILDSDRDAAHAADP